MVVAEADGMRFVVIDLTQHQFNTLDILTFSPGAPKLVSSTLLTMLFAVSLLEGLAGCTSGQNVPCPVKAERHAPSAWSMEPPSGLLERLD